MHHFHIIKCQLNATNLIIQTRLQTFRITEPTGTWPQQMSSGTKNLCHHIQRYNRYVYYTRRLFLKNHPLGHGGTSTVFFFKLSHVPHPGGLKFKKSKNSKSCCLVMVMGASPWPLRVQLRRTNNMKVCIICVCFALFWFPLFMFCLLFSFVCCRCCCCCCCCCLLLCVQHRTTAISISCDIINDLTTTCRYVLLCLFLLRFIFFTFFLLLLLLLLLLCA